MLALILSVISEFFGSLVISVSSLSSFPVTLNDEYAIFRKAFFPFFIVDTSMDGIRQLQLLTMRLIFKSSLPLFVIANVVLG